MPELPEVETVRRTLNNMILGRTIKSIDVHYSKIIKDVSVSEFKSKLVGQTLIDINRYGKYLIFLFEDIALISHLRMEGKYFIKDSIDPLEKHEHIVFNFTDGSTLRYHDVRKFGTMDLRMLNEIYTTYPISKLGYEPYDKLMTVNHLKGKLKNKGTAIKTCLLDQTIAADRKLGDLLCQRAHHHRLFYKPICRNLIDRHNNDGVHRGTFFLC